MTRPVALFRADASKRTGAGHAIRCLALAQAWNDLGGSSLFVMGESAELVDRSLYEEGIEVRRLEDRGPLALAESAAHENASWIVLDGYQFDAAFEKALRSANPDCELLSIDDKMRETASDIFVLPSSGVHRREKETSSAKVLAGWKYALLRRDFRRSLPSKVGKHTRILVALGGTDAADKASEVAQALVGPAARYGWDVQVISRGKLPPAVSRVEPQPDISSLVAVADAGVSTASTAALEFCTMGVPTVLMVVAENQRHTADLLVSAGASLAADSVDEIESGLLDILAHRDAMSTIAAGLVDGKGAHRVAKVMMCWSPHIRAVARGDGDLLLAWANDLETRANSFHEETIKPAEHKAWLDTKLSDKRCWMCLAEDATGRCFGTVRIEGDDRPTVSISLAPTHRGLGLGERLLSSACAAYPQRKRRMLRAEVRKENLASKKIFEANGFRVVAEKCDRLVYGKDPS